VAALREAGAFLAVVVVAGDLVAAARAEWWDIEKLVELRTDVYKAVKRY
jgi:hypothetical protein